MTTRTLKRKLKSYGLQKRNNDVTEDVLRQLIEREIQGPGSLRGYRGLCHHLKMSYEISIKRDDVMRLLKRSTLKETMSEEGIDSIDGFTCPLAQINVGTLMAMTN